MRPFCLFLTGLCFAAAPLSAQRLDPDPFPRAELGFGAPAPGAGPAPRSAATRIAVGSPHTGSMILGGLLGGAAGLVAGAKLGDQFERRPCEDCIEGALWGGLGGVSAGVPLGVYLANGARGSVLLELGASLGIAALGLTAAVATDQYGIMFAVPVLQIVSSIAIERRARRGRE